MHSGMSLMSLTLFGDRDKGPVADLVFLDAPIDGKEELQWTFAMTM